MNYNLQTYTSDFPYTCLIPLPPTQPKTLLWLRKPSLRDSKQLNHRDLGGESLGFSWVLCCSSSGPVSEPELGGHRRRDMDILQPATGGQLLRNAVSRH